MNKTGYPLLVTAAIIEHGGKILLTKRRDDVPYPNLWEFPGGKLEADEDPRDCIVRELKEELDIEVVPGDVVEAIYHRYPERTVLVLAYRCRWTGGEIRDLEVAEHCWAAPAELSRFALLPADYPLAKRLAQELR